MTKPTVTSSVDSSRARAKSSLAKMGWTAAHIVASSTPGASPAIELLRILAEHLRQYREDRSNERVSRFARQVLDGVPPENRANFLEREIDQADYHALLTAVVSDDEDEKEELYANTLRALVMNDIDPDLRRYVVRTVANLSFAELKLAQRLYIASRFLFPTYNAFRANPDEQVDSILRPRGPLERLYVRGLQDHGLVEESFVPSDRPEAGMPNRKMRPSSLLKVVAETAFRSDDLTPEAIGMKQRSPLADTFGVYIACASRDMNSPQLYRLVDALFRAEILNEIRDPNGDRGAARDCSRALMIAVCLSESGNPYEAVIERGEVDPSAKEIIVVLLEGASDDSAIPRSHTLDLRRTDRDPLPKFVQSITPRLLQLIGERKTAQARN